MGSVVPLAEWTFTLATDLSLLHIALLTKPASTGLQNVLCRHGIPSSAVSDPGTHITKNPA